MSLGGQSSVLPLRPLTTGELLDAAVLLLRGYGRVLLPVAAVVAALEQVLVLIPLRMAWNADPPFYLTGEDSIGTYWVLFGICCGTEAAILVTLGGLTARAAAADVLGTRLTARELLHPREWRMGLVLVVAAFIGLVAFVGGLLVPLWVIVHASVGLIVPVLVVDRLSLGKAVARGSGLAWRNGARAAGVRLLAYLAWLAVRLALGLGGLAAVEGLGLDDSAWAPLLAAAVWLLANTVAYPSLACLDAVLHLETRMRTEGLDIWLSRAARHGPLRPHLLAVRR